MILTNSQVGRIQLMFERIVGLRYQLDTLEKFNGEAFMEAMYEIVQYWPNYQAVMKLSSDLKDLYNVNEAIEMKPTKRRSK